MHAPSPVHEEVLQVALELRAALEPLAAAAPIAAAESLSPLVTKALDRCVARLRALDLWGPANRVPSSELWNVAGDLLERGWLQHRARAKPRGYAGDHEMLAAIYDHRLCDDPLGRHFDRYFQDQAAPCAVRQRMRLMADWIAAAIAAPVADDARSPEIQVAMVGSAFGAEVLAALERSDPPARERLRVALLDLDPEAVEVARRTLAPHLAADRLVVGSANLFRLAERPRLVSPLRGSRLLLCPGLFDYLDDAAACAMLRTLYEQLAPGGELVVFQFAPHNPTRTYMEWIGNWYLIYRTADELRELAAAAGIAAAEISLGAEPLGVNLFLRVRRPA